MDKKILKIAYVPPRTEVYATEPSAPLAVSTTIFTGTHDDGVDEGIVTGAKQVVILGQEFSFKDLWEE